MEIKRATANNRKVFRYALLHIQRDSDDRIEKVTPEPELGSEGRGDTIHLDAVREHNQDPEYLKDLLLHRLTVEAQKAIDSTDLSKRQIIRTLGTSASQLYRLLDPTNHTKSVGQMLAILHLLGRKVDVVISPRDRTRPGLSGVEHQDTVPDAGAVPVWLVDAVSTALSPCGFCQRNSESDIQCSRSRWRDPF